MKIPRELFEKYLIEYDNLDNVPEDSFEINQYNLFLNVTDYKIVKSYEQLMSDPNNFTENLVKVNLELQEINNYRQVARDEINRLREEMNPKPSEDSHSAPPIE